jgi:hypothetical protein
MKSILELAGTPNTWMVPAVRGFLVDIGAALGVVRMM